jgi:hypothetical protein
MMQKLFSPLFNGNTELPEEHPFKHTYFPVGSGATSTSSDITSLLLHLK